MAARLRGHHSEEVRSKIQASQLINRLQCCALEDLELRPDQLKAIEILLKKSLPDLTAVEISGDPENPVSLKATVEFVHARPTAEQP